MQGKTKTIAKRRSKVSSGCVVQAGGQQSGRTELMGVTAAAAAASINLPNLHAPLRASACLSLPLSAGAVQKNCIKSFRIFGGIRGGLSHLKFGISTSAACGFPRSQKRDNLGRGDN